MSTFNTPQLVIVKQFIGTHFLELVEAIAQQLESIYLITGTSIEKNLPGVDVCLLTPYNRQKLFSRARSWISFLGASILELWKVDARIPLLVVSNPPLLPWLALLLNYIRQQPYIILVHDIYPDILVNQGRLGSRNLLTHVWRYFNRLSYQKATRVVTIGKHMGQTITNSSKRPVNLSIIPTWVDTNHFMPRNKKENFFAIQHDQQDKFTVLYSGNIGYSHDIQIMIDAAKQLKEYCSFHFLIIGDGPGKVDLVKKVQTAQLTNITFLPFQWEEVLPYSLAVADVFVVSMARGTEGLMMPSKTYYGMAVGAALVGVSHPPNDLADVIEQHSCGVNIKPDDVDSFVTALRRFETDRNYFSACRTSARHIAVEKFEKSINTQQFVELITLYFDTN